MNVIIYGTKKCAMSRNAERFFRERRIPAQFRDVAEKPLTEGELRNIAGGRAVAELVDAESKAFARRGLAFMEYDALDELVADPLLLKTPVVRIDKKYWIRPDLATLPI
jgi:arsenate reductase (glutaredoxin)